MATSSPLTEAPSSPIAARFAAVRADIAAASRAAGRDPGDVTLTAVTKTQPPDAIDAALATGQRVFGENRVQEAMTRWIDRRPLHPDLHLRLIGPLQTNKVREALALFDVIETLDRPRLAQALATAGQAMGVAPRVLVQVNTGAELQKAGVAVAEAPALIEQARILGLTVEGLMCIPPADQDPAPHFALLAGMAQDEGLSVLSMGMSGDYPAAIAAGATHVRVGSALLGLATPETASNRALPLANAATLAIVAVMAAPKTILIIDDDDDLREALAEQLALHEAFRPIQASTATDGVRMGREVRADLILLDLDLPDMDGREACRLLRSGGVTTPIIMLTAQSSDSDTVLGLESGANDYVTKPFRFAVLLARIRAHLRSHEQSEDAVFRIGPYEFRPAAKVLIDDKARKVRLTEKETNILKYLYRASGKPVMREELLTEVWGYNAGVTTHTLETHIYRLRQKIEPEPGQARLLLTDAGGYRLQP